MGRLAPDGFNTIDGIYRANADGALTTIAEDQRRFVFVGVNPSINDSGQVSFAARSTAARNQTPRPSCGATAGSLVPSRRRWTDSNFFGFHTSINNSGQVAFTAELDEGFGFDEGLFSGTGGKRGVTTHYLTSTSEFDGSDSRPSINDSGNIAFVESVDFARGIFVGREGEFTTVVEPDPSDPSVGFEAPILNNAGTVACKKTSFDETAQQSVEEIVKIDADGTSTVVADTRGEFASFGFRPPSLNNNSDVAFLADLDSGGSGVFVGPDPINDRVISTGDALDGSTVRNITFCEEGLSDPGELAFVVQLADNPDTPEDDSRTAVFRATPAP